MHIPVAIDETVEHSSAIVHFSRVVAWSSFTAGAASGLVLGLWSFDGPFPVPSWIGEYGDVSRRLLRLSHIAFFGLAMLNLLLARHLPTLKLSGRMAWLALAGMNFGNIVMPMILVAATFAAEVEDRFQLVISDERLAGLKTLSDLAGAVETTLREAA